MTTMENGYSSDNTHRKLSDEYQHDKVKMILIFCALDKSNLSSIRVKGRLGRPSDSVLASRVSGCLLDSLVHGKYLILGKRHPKFWYVFLLILIPS